MKIKGIQKQLVVVRTVGSPYFDEAYFVLRTEEETKRRSKCDILTEAQRILQDCAHSQEPPKKPRRRALFSFLIGALCGAGLTCLLFWLIF